MDTVSVKIARDVDQANAYTVTKDGNRHTVWTGPNGTGLWIDGRQVAGTSQFSAGRNPAQAIRRYCERYL